MAWVCEVLTEIGYPTFLTVEYISTANASGAGRAFSGCLHEDSSILHSLHSGHPPNNRKKAFSKPDRKTSRSSLFNFKVIFLYHLKRFSGASNCASIWKITACSYSLKTVRTLSLMVYWADKLLCAHS